MSLTAAVLAWGLGTSLLESQRHSFEQAAAAEIAGRLEGEAKQVDVKTVPRGLAALWGELESAQIQASSFSVDSLPLYVEPKRSTRGILSLLELRLKHFTLRGLEVESLSADIPGCRYDFGLALGHRRFRLSRSGTGRGQVEIREEALARYILHKFHDIKRCTVTADRGVVWVEGYGEFLIAKTNFEVVAKIGAVDGTKLVLENPKIFFDWVRASPEAGDALLKILNPVVDLKKDLRLYDAVSVDRITCEGGFLRAEGATKIPNLPAKNGT